MSAREFWSDVLLGVGGILVAVLLIGAFFLTGQSNGHKDLEMGKACIAHGYQGWDGTRCTR